MILKKLFGYQLQQQEKNKLKYMINWETILKKWIKIVLKNL